SRSSMNTPNARPKTPTTPGRRPRRRHDMVDATTRGSENNTINVNTNNTSNNTQFARWTVITSPARVPPNPRRGSPHLIPSEPIQLLGPRRRAASAAQHRPGPLQPDPPTGPRLGTVAGIRVDAGQTRPARRPGRAGACRDRQLAHARARRLVVSVARRQSPRAADLPGGAGDLPETSAPQGRLAAN
ncbi:hypothetical protein A1O1_03098, partial [Capronia coronata CBS 617.96]